MAIDKHVIARLEGAVAAASPDKRPLAQAALDIAKSAFAEIQVLKSRTAEAESVALQARPVIEQLSKRAESLEAEVQVAQTKVQVARSAEHDRRVVQDRIEKRTNDEQIRKALAEIEKSFDQTKDFLIFLAKCTRYVDTQRSILSNISRSYGEIEVLHPATGEVTVHESKAEAVARSQEIIAELEAIDKSDQNADEFERDRRMHGGDTAPLHGFPTGAGPGPFVEQDEIVPGHAGGMSMLDGVRRPKRKKKKSRLL